MTNLVTEELQLTQVEFRSLLLDKHVWVEELCKSFLLLLRNGLQRLVHAFNTVSSLLEIAFPLACISLEKLL